MVVRFGEFDFDTATGELRRKGVAVRLQAQPAQVLGLLIEARGELVTRESLRTAVWNDSFVDFNRSINFCIAQVRGALGDTADSPRFVRTVPKRGYQFIAPTSFPPVEEEPAAAEPEAAARPRSSLSRRTIVLGSCVAAGGGVLAFRLWTVSPEKPKIAVARFDNETGDAAVDRLADGITDLLVAELTAGLGDQLGVIGNAAILRGPRQTRNLADIATTLDARFVVLGQIQPDGANLRVLAHLIRMPKQIHLGVCRLVVQPDNPEKAAEAIAGEFKRKLSSHNAVTG